jgi:hypothetical protein
MVRSFVSWATTVAVEVSDVMSVRVGVTEPHELTSLWATSRANETPSGESQPRSS